MIVTPIKTPLIRAGSIQLLDLVDQTIDELQDGDILAVSSKIVALCENNVRRMEDTADATHPTDLTGRETLIAEQADYFLPTDYSPYNYHFSIIGHTLVGSAGIDTSNADGHFVLWPKDPQASANDLRAHLMQRFGLKRLGIIITDSVSQPMRLGAIGITIAHTGFVSINDNRGQPDLFGRPLVVSRANTASGLAAAAVLTMGESTEQTPLCLIRDVPFIEFQDHDPTPEELAAIHVSMDDDLFAPFWRSAPWQRGQGGNTSSDSQ